MGEGKGRHAENEIKSVTWHLEEINLLFKMKFKKFTLANKDINKHTGDHKCDLLIKQPFSAMLPHFTRGWRVSVSTNTAQIWAPTHSRAADRTDLSGYVRAASPALVYERRSSSNLDDCSHDLSKSTAETQGSHSFDHKFLKSNLALKAAGSKSKGNFHFL